MFKYVISFSQSEVSKFKVCIVFKWATEAPEVGSLLLCLSVLRCQPFVIDSLLLGLEFAEAVFLLVTYCLLLSLLIFVPCRQTIGIELNVCAVFTLWEDLEPVGARRGFFLEIELLFGSFRLFLCSCFL